MPHGVRIFFGLLGAFFKFGSFGRAVPRERTRASNVSLRCFNRLDLSRRDAVDKQQMVRTLKAINWGQIKIEYEYQRGFSGERVTRT